MICLLAGPWPWFPPTPPYLVISSPPPSPIPPFSFTFSINLAAALFLPRHVTPTTSPSMMLCSKQFLRRICVVQFVFILKTSQGFSFTFLRTFSFFFTTSVYLSSSSPPPLPPSSFQFFSNATFQDSPGISCPFHVPDLHKYVLEMQHFYRVLPEYLMK